MTAVLVLVLGIVLSTVILIVSMVLASSLMGGIEFGAIHLVLLKAVPLLVAVNALALIPYGAYLTLPVWWGGLMLLFRLDFWEARTLVALNYILNLLAQTVLMAALK